MQLERCKTPPLIPFLIQMNLVDNVISNLSTIHLNVILTSTLCLTDGSSLQALRLKFLCMLPA